MKKKYITRDKIADFLEKMWEAGIKAEFDPAKSEICLTKSAGGYEWIPVYPAQYYDEMVESILKDKP